ERLNSGELSGSEIRAKARQTDRIFTSDGHTQISHVREPAVANQVPVCPCIANGDVVPGMILSAIARKEVSAGYAVRSPLKTAMEIAAEYTMILKDVVRFDNV